MVSLSCFCNTETHTRWEKLTECPQAHRSQTNWNQKVDDGNCHLHHHQAIRRMSTPASLLSQGPTHWLHGLCGGGSESWSVASPRLLRKAALLGFPHRQMRSPSRSSQPRPGPPDPRALASAFQPQLPSKCLLCPLCTPRTQTWGGRETLLVKSLATAQLLGVPARCGWASAGLYPSWARHPPPRPQQLHPHLRPSTELCIFHSPRWVAGGSAWLRLPLRAEHPKKAIPTPPPPKKGECPQADHALPGPLL